MHLVDYIDAVFSHLRGNSHLVHQVLDVLNTVVGGGIKLVDAVGTAFSEGFAGLALAARLHIRGRVGAVYHLREDAGRGGFAHSARAAEEVGVRKLSPQNGVFEGAGYVVLADERAEIVRAIFASRNDVLFHIYFLNIQPAKIANLHETC